MIKLLAMDVDGTLTDGKICMGESGEIFKAFSAKDGYAIKIILRRNSILPVIITGRVSKIVENRAAELGITELYQGVSDKAKVMREVAEKYGCTREEIAYIGDDDNDLEAMSIAGVVGCPADSSVNVKSIAGFVSAKNGGDGAVREFVEMIVRI